MSDPMVQPPMPAWIGVDFDGTLATQGDINHTGEPVEAMMARVRDWLAQGIEVRIFTARVCLPELRERQTRIVQDWLEAHGLPRLAVTNAKDFGTIAVWDDRVVAIERNTGGILGGA